MQISHESSHYRDMLTSPPAYARITYDRANQLKRVPRRCQNYSDVVNDKHAQPRLSMQAQSVRTWYYPNVV